MQIAFLTLFLGLVAGPQTVAVEPGTGVAAVELALDGREFARLERAPWSARVDFGPALLPHRLEARGLAADGSEVARAEQWVNLPRPQAEVDIVLEGSAVIRTRTARLIWDSFARQAPSEIKLTLDGAPLALDARARTRIEIPKAGGAHVLSARLRFPDGLEARKDVVLTGDYGSDVATELTAVAVRGAVPGKPGHALAAQDLRGRFLAEGRPVEVAAIEQEPADVLVVRAGGAASALLGVTHGRTGAYYGMFTPDPRLQFHFVSPVARLFKSGAATTAELFDITPAMALPGMDLGRLLLAVHFRFTGHPRLADAVGAASLHALARETPRAVVLIVAPADGAPDPSQFPPATVRAYLSAIGVPLFVWSIGRPGGQLAGWGEIQDIARPWDLRHAYERLEKEVLSQQIVWLQGRHLPQAITLAPGGGPADGLQLVAAAPPQP
ncbi:MAG: hypothetical protein JOZ15_02665 [Acidobacteria bacterium]|nr:hypothetical protein [Acidobacteriota bacterium]